jgi:hypothetical protein
MAAGFRVEGQNRTVLVRSPTLVEDAVEIHARATPSNIGFVRVILYSTWAKSGVKAALEPIADNIEQIVKNHNVVSGAPVQQVDASGLVSNFVEFIVTTKAQAGSPSPTMTAPVRIPVQALHDLSGFESYFQPVEKALAAAAGA